MPMNQLHLCISAWDGRISLKCWVKEIGIKQWRVFSSHLHKFQNKFIIMLADTHLFSVPIKQGDDYHKSQDNDYAKCKKEILIQKAVEGSGELELGKFLFT